MKMVLLSILALVSIQVHAKKAVTEAGIIAMAKSHGLECNLKGDSDESVPVEVVKFDHKWIPSERSDEESQSYYIASCAYGASNRASMLFIDDRYFGIQPIPLSVPILNYKSEIAGFSSQVVVTGLSYDDKEKVLSTFEKGRPGGDTGMHAVYAFWNRTVLLRKFSMDTTENGKIDPKVIYEAKGTLEF